LVVRPSNPACEQSLTDEQAEPERPEGGSGRPSWSAPRRLAVRRSAAWRDPVPDWSTV